MKLLNSKFSRFVFLIILVLIFFWQFFLKGLLPIPSDTIVGLYHPYRDLYAKDYPRGIPFKNFLITDPVRQQYPWKDLSIDLLKTGKLPLWNPYTFSGTPLLANFQSAVFYPLNIIFFILPFNLAWSWLIVLEVFLGLVFMYSYLDNLKLNKFASLLGSIVFSFCGFNIAWLEWGNILHTVIWLPLILLAIDKITENRQSKNLRLFWPFVFVFSLISSFFAGHLQIFFYLLVLSLIYFFYRWMESGKNIGILIKFIIYYFLFVVITSIQWIPTLIFIQESARNIDQSDWQKIGWFIPWQNLLQFVVPDFFGNPATLNYWGVFNYGEFIGYIGVAPLLFAVYALFFRKDNRIFLFGFIFFTGLIFSFPTIFAKIPYLLNLPLISTSQPTRLIFITDFSLAVLSAFGLDAFIKSGNKNIKYPWLFLAFIYLFIWLGIYILSKQSQLAGNLLVAKNNLILPSFIFVLLTVPLLINYLRTSKRFKEVLIIFIVLLTVFDLFRFGWKFTPFTKKEYLFPQTETLKFLESRKGEFRIMTTDPRIFSPNFSVIHKLQSVDGYDPLYLKGYGELIVSLERGKPDISGPFGFDRIITPHNIDSKLVDLLGVKYVMSLSDLTSDGFKKVFREGETRVYENEKVMPRAFFVDQTINSNSSTNSIKLLFDKDLAKTAITENFKNATWSKGKATISKYEENSVSIQTENEGEGFVVLTDSFYPTWHAMIDGKKTMVYKTDFNFRGISVPKGKHSIEFYVTLF